MKLEVVYCGFEEKRRKKQNSHHLYGRVNGLEKSNMIIKQHMGSLEVHNQDHLSSVHSFA